MERGTVGIAGLGLIGASVGQGLMSGYASNVVGHDPSGRAQDDAGDCVHEIVSGLDGFRGCGLIVIAAPPRAVPEILIGLEDVVGETDCAVTDVTSLKQAIVSAVPSSYRTRFVPGHPMAGHETTGSKYARADLFHGAKWIVCPDEDVETESLNRVLGMVRHLRALPVFMTAEEHDQHAALLSHLPHVLASALLIRSESLTRSDIAGGSWRDLTRVGGANPELWAEILTANKEAVLASLKQTDLVLGQFAEAVEQGDTDRLVELIERAKELKNE